MVRLVASIICDDILRIDMKSYLLCYLSHSLAHRSDCILYSTHHLLPVTCTAFSSFKTLSCFEQEYSEALTYPYWCLTSDTMLRYKLNSIITSRWQLPLGPPNITGSPDYAEHYKNFRSCISEGNFSDLSEPQLL